MIDQKIRKYQIKNWTVLGAGLICVLGYGVFMGDRLQERIRILDSEEINGHRIEHIETYKKFNFLVGENRIKVDGEVVGTFPDSLDAALFYDVKRQNLEEGLEE